MDLEGELPVLREQYGSSRASRHAASYVCDHMGIRRADARPRAINLGASKTIAQFVKVIDGTKIVIICSSCHLWSFLAVPLSCCL